MPLEFDEAAHVYRFEGRIVPSVTQILERVGVIDYSAIPESTREMAMARGRRVHAATHYDDEGQLDEGTVYPDDLGYLQAWRKFRAESGFMPELLEHRGYHEVYGYAGTLDRRGTIRNGSVLLDIKTGHAPWWTAIQTAAYGAFFPNPRTPRMAVELHADGSYRVEEFRCGNWHQDFNDFLSCLNVFNLLTREVR